MFWGSTLAVASIAAVGQVSFAHPVLRGALLSSLAWLRISFGGHGGLGLGHQQFKRVESHPTGGIAHAQGPRGCVPMLKILLLATQLSAAPPIAFDEAKSLADANEMRLSKDMKAQLLQSQGNALGAAMARCGRPGMDLSAFTVVFALGDDGSVAHSWRRGETPLALCMHRALVASGFPGQWPTPFYTSIHLSFNTP